MKTLALFLLFVIMYVQQGFAQNSKDTLVVSFISIGAGTDYKAKQKLDLYAKDFEQTEHVQLNVTVKHWGKEGETDYTYDLKNLSKKQCKAFTENVEAMFLKNNLMKIVHKKL